MRWAAGGVLFALLATANAAGYRYGTSDQAFYVPSLVRLLDPAAFPRDAALIDAQGRLMLWDEVMAVLVSGTGLSIETLFFAGYVVALALIWAALVLIGRSVYGSAWLTVALGAAFTLRHRIPRTSANSFEPYFSPRMIAFALGALAIAALLRRRVWPAIVLIGVSAIVHATTALWFAVVAGVALTLLDARWRRVAIAGAVLVALVGAWAVTAGPLRASMTTMDEAWLRGVASKDSLFASQWPLWAWAANLGLLGVLWWAHRRRVAAGRATPYDHALVWGATALVAMFLLTLPAVVARLALPVQLQLPRVFWVVDFLATVYILGTIRREQAARAVALLLVAISAARGVYVMTIEHPERELFGIQLPQTPWDDAMAWVKGQPADVHVLADPGHAWRYGTSVRVAARRDVFIEEVKDSAVAIYSREVAVRYNERLAVVGDFAALTPAHARELASNYDLDYVVTEGTMDLPLAFENSQFRVYSLR